MLRHREEKHFDVNFPRIRPLHFPSEDGKDAAYEERIGWKCVQFRLSWQFYFVNKKITVLFPTSFLDLACKQLFFQQSKEYKLLKWKY